MGDGLRLLGLSPFADDETFILGQGVLRSAYVILDLDNKNVRMPSARWNVTDSNIVELDGSIEVPATPVSNLTATETAVVTGDGPGAEDLSVTILNSHTVTPTFAGPAASSSDDPAVASTCIKQPALSLALVCLYRSIALIAVSLSRADNRPIESTENWANIQ
jgi:hypothetical protein